jgi:hypothetical protein
MTTSSTAQRISVEDLEKLRKGYGPGGFALGKEASFFAERQLFEH